MLSGHYLIKIEIGPLTAKQKDQVGGLLAGLIEAHVISFAYYFNLKLMSINELKIRETDFAKLELKVRF